MINLLHPQAGRRRAPAVESKSGSRKPRQMKVYKNPHTGELIETKAGNHKGLKEWKAEHGSATVESWLTIFFWFDKKRARGGPFFRIALCAFR
jgi:hypothetical protein